MRKRTAKRTPGWLEGENRRCFREGEPSPEFQTQKENPADEGKSKERYQNKKDPSKEKESRAEDAQQLQKMEQALELSSYRELREELQKFQSGEKVNLEQIAKTMKSVAESPGAPEIFSNISVAKLAIMERDAVSQLSKNILTRIEELEKQEKMNEFTEVQKGFKNELPVSNVFLTLKPSSDFYQTYNPEGKPITSLKMAKETALPVLGVAQVDGNTWYKLGKPTEAPPPFKEEFIYRTSEDIDLTKDISKDDLRHLIVRYETILSRMKEHRKGRGDVRQTVEIIRSLEKFLAEIVSGKKDLSAEAVQSYRGTIHSLFHSNVHLLSLGEIAIMEREDFDAIIGTFEALHQRHLTMLDEKNSK